MIGEPYFQSDNEKGAFREKSKANMLACNSKLGKKDARVQIIRQGTRNKNVKNIAVIGPYGSGKSSVVKSFIDSKIINNKAIYFNLDTFNNYAKDGEITKDNIINIIYCELLKRNTSSVMLDKYFKRLFGYAKEKWLLFFYIVFSACVAFLGATFLWNGLAEKWRFLSVIVGIAFFSLALFIYLFIASCRAKAYFKSKNFEVAFEWENKQTSIVKEAEGHPGLVENAVIKQLKKDRIRYIVFEDVDRLKDKEYVGFIERIKCFNDLLNQSKEFKWPRKRIVFFYEIKDDCFVDSEKRTKYFDLIVPVVSYANFVNAADSILQDRFVRKFIDKNAVIDLSTFLLDQRQVNDVLTEFFVKRQTTRSELLLVELFALSVFNVRFPSLYAQLNVKNNFFGELISDYEKNQMMFDTFDVASPRSNELNSLKHFRDQISILKSDTEKSDCVLFIKTCLRQKYITQNYEILVHSNIENGMSAADLYFLQLFQAGQYDVDYKIRSPYEVISYKPDSSYLFKNKKGLNKYLLCYIVLVKEKNNKLDDYKKIAASTLKSMTNDEMEKYLNGGNEYVDEMLYHAVNELIPEYGSVYFSSSKIKDSEDRNRICLYLFNGIKQIQNVLDKNSYSPFLNIINSETFLVECGSEVKNEVLLSLLKNALLCPQTLKYFERNEELVGILKKTNSYDKTFENLCFVFDGFYETPLGTLLNNPDTLTSLFGSETFGEVLNNCNCVSSSDSKEDLISFINKLITTQQLSILSSKYFEQWRRTIITPCEKSTKFESLITNRLLDMSDSNVIDFVANNYLDIFVSDVSSQVDYYTTLKFSKGTSWILFNKLDDDKLIALKQSLSLTESVNYLNKIDEQKIKTLLAIVDDSEKQKIISYIMSNDPNNIIDLYANGTISMDSFKSVTISKEFLDAVIKSEVKVLLNLCVLSQNTKISVEYLKNNPNVNFYEMFVGAEGEILNCDDVELIVEYCCNKQRDFVFVRKLVTSLSEEKTSSLEQWLPFLNSFKLSKSAVGSKYIYFENNENNNIIIRFFESRGLFKSVVLQNGDTTIRCCI